MIHRSARCSVHRHVYRHVYRHVHIRVYGHVHRHVHRHVHGHVYRHVHRHVNEHLQGEPQQLILAQLKDIQLPALTERSNIRSNVRQNARWTILDGPFDGASDGPFSISPEKILIRMRVENSSKWNRKSPWQFLKWAESAYLAVKNVRQHRNICRDVKVKSRRPHPDGGGLQPQVEMGQFLTTLGKPLLRNEEPGLPRRPAIPFRGVFWLCGF